MYQSNYNANPTLTLNPFTDSIEAIAVFKSNKEFLDSLNKAIVDAGGNPGSVVHPEGGRMKIDKKYVFDGNIIHLIIGFLILYSKWCFRSLLKMAEDVALFLEKPISWIVFIVAIPFVIIYIPIRMLFAFAKVLYTIRMRKIATEANMRADKLVWHPKDGVFLWHKGFTSALNNSELFLPNNRDLMKYALKTQEEERIDKIRITE